MKVALACDWLTNVGGAERVLLSLHQLYPDAPIYTSQYNKKGITWFADAEVHTGWLQIFPSALRRFLGPLRQIYFNHLDLSAYDVVISVTGAEAKSIRHPHHICYCHVPTQYYWQMFDSYLEHPGFGFLNPLVRFCLKVFIKPLRRADYKAAQHPTQFVTISTYARELIKRYYDRESLIVNPPVAVENFRQRTNRPAAKSQAEPPYFITTSRQVTWKRLDLAITACLRAKARLIVIGSGPEHQHLRKLAGDSPLITFIPELTQAQLVPYLQNAKAYLFPSIEPFGIAPVEALAAGCPVIALKAGASPDYIQEGINGLFFDHQTTASLAAAIRRFDSLQFDRAKVSRTALPFSDPRFKREMKEVVDGR